MSRYHLRLLRSKRWCQQANVGRFVGARLKLSEDAGERSLPSSSNGPKYWATPQNARHPR